MAQRWAYAKLALAVLYVRCLDTFRSWCGSRRTRRQGAFYIASVERIYTVFTEEKRTFDATTTTTRQKKNAVVLIDRFDPHLGCLGFFNSLNEPLGVASSASQTPHHLTLLRVVQFVQFLARSTASSGCPTLLTLHTPERETTPPRILVVVECVDRTSKAPFFFFLTRESPVRDLRAPIERPEAVTCASQLQFDVVFAPVDLPADNNNSNDAQKEAAEALVVSPKAKCTWNVGDDCAKLANALSVCCACEDEHALDTLWFLNALLSHWKTTHHTRADAGRRHSWCDDVLDRIVRDDDRLRILSFALRADDRVFLPLAAEPLFNFLSF